MPLVKSGLIKGLAHITGGGLTENTPRMLPDNLAPQYDERALVLPPVFEWLMKTGGVALSEMHRTFNCGIGMVICIDPKDLEIVLSQLMESGEDAFVIGQLVGK